MIHYDFHYLQSNFHVTGFKVTSETSFQGKYNDIDENREFEIKSVIEIGPIYRGNVK